jgi:hypothetical protein
VYQQILKGGKNIWGLYDTYEWGINIWGLLRYRKRDNIRLLQFFYKLDSLQTADISSGFRNVPDQED